MTPHQIVAVALRLVAIWLGMQALGYVAWFFWGKGSQPPDYAYLTFMLALNVVIIPALWFFPRTIAWKLLPSDDVQPRPPVTADTWLALGCTLIGLWTLTTTVPQIVYHLLVLNSMLSEGDRSWSWVHWSLLHDVVQLAIAAWLVLGAKGVGKIFQWAQYAGTRKDL